MDSDLNRRPECAACGGRLFRVRRRFIDRVMHLVRPVKRYKCEDCGAACNVRVQGHPPRHLEASNAPR
jgi:hypothetical protein